MSWIGMHKLAEVIFRVTQKPFYITSTLSGNTSLINKFFWNCFVVWRATGHQFQATFVFCNLVHEKGLGSKDRIKLAFSRFFDNPLSKYLIIKIIT